MSAIVFADGNFQATTVGRSQIGARPPKISTAILGTFDDWGTGKVECPPDRSTANQGAYEVFTNRGQKFVSVTNPSNGVVTSIDLNDRKRLQESQMALRLRLNNFVTVRYDPEL